MINKETKYFADIQTGKINSDDSPFALNPNEWVNASNIRTGTTDGGVTAIVESIGSTKMVSQPQPSVTFMELGSVDDTDNGRALTIYFDKVGTNHKIEAYYPLTGITYIVLRSDDVVGGLNLSKDSPIHSMRVVNGLLTWCDSTINEPRQINVDAGIKAYDPSFVTNATPLIFPLLLNEVTLIKSPPPLAPNFQKLTDGAFAPNFIANNSFEFAFQYSWIDNQTTVTGVYSANSRLNKVTDTYNYIQVSMDGEEYIPSRVLIVSLIVRFSNTNNAKVVKVWDKRVPSESALIAGQNAGVPLSYNFYNNIDGIPIATDDVLRPYDNVPIYSETLETAKSRLFFGNNTEGYNTPLTTSLSATLITTPIGSTSLNKNVLFIAQNRTVITPSQRWAYSGYYVYLTEVSPAGYYAITATEQQVTGTATIPPLPAVPTSVAFTGLTFRGGDLNSALLSTVPIGYGVRTGYAYGGLPNVISITGASISVYDVFKANSVYKYGIVFYDYAMRKCGVATTDGLQIPIPSRDYNYSTGVNGIVWQLSNTNAINEIPAWASYYAVVRTLNQRTRFFVDSFTDAAKYAQKSPNGTYTFTSNTFVTGAIGIAVNTTALYQGGLGYVFTEGDICLLTRDDNTQYELPVIAQDGNYIVLKCSDIGSTAGRKYIYEIYTPYKTSEQEPFFEIGELYKVLNPGTGARAYGTLGDVFSPDAYVLTRNYTSNTYFAEAMCPNDAFYKRWDNDGGKENFITKLGQVKKIHSISWSDTFIPNTAINGLSTFRVFNQKSVPEDCGAITKLQLTSKISQEGTVMLSICTVETNSMYLSEQQITDNTGATQFFSSSDNVIGTINTLKGNFGCIDPTSVVQYRGNVFFLDAYNGRMIQYSINGLDPISNYKMVRFWKLWCAKYMSLTKADIEAFGDRPFIFTAVDSAHDELLISLPKLSNDPPKGYLPDYPNMIYPFDILDYQGKTIAYSIGTGSALPKFLGSYSFIHNEGFVTLLNKLYSWCNGNMYEHNQLSSQNNFYGVQYTSKIMFPSNMMAQLPKQYDNFASQSNISPKFVYFYNDYPVQQSSDLEDISFRDVEGVFYAPILRNKLIPTAIGYDTNGLLTGEKMRNTAMLIMAEYAPTKSPLNLRFITIAFSLSKGHRLTN